MANEFGRRDFLKSSAAIAGTAVVCGGTIHTHPVRAAQIEVPVVDGLAIQVLLDSSHDIFLRPQEVNGVQVERARGAPISAGSCTISGVSRCCSSPSGR